MREATGSTVLIKASFVGSTKYDVKYMPVEDVAILNSCTGMVENTVATVIAVMLDENVAG
eukprot:14572354-Ditylum_brightwellii.AAC.1